MDEMSTIRPYLARTIAATAARHRPNEAVRFVAMT